MNTDMNLFKKSSVALATTSLFLFSAFQVSAESLLPSNDEAPLVVLQNDSTVNDLVRYVIIILVAIGVIAALIFLIWGGVKWIISGGNEDKVKEARQQIIAAIIGLVVLLLSVVVLNFVMGMLGVGSVLSPNIPNLKCYLDDRNGDCEAELSGSGEGPDSQQEEDPGDQSQDR